ncbi:ATP-binding protein [Streptomyces katsurahamanus]|uniref:Helix-turn-helix transcriptional regulator n=1 Tax=Streptomyces katsurahamanus TaxID=2577098 RepID=A0ABW9NXH0_9ACTN|nr:LuxR family transcriptional regulator [Streptomyces katsurahamanus]MQS37744.1 helix-turn-helix transcriptional regulator [Streptomyces katsurahamanus]
MPAQRKKGERAQVLMERDEVLGTAAAAAEAARAGNGRWMLLSAAVAGMGRTAALDAIVRRQAADGAMRIGCARGAPEETAFPFGLVRQLFADDVDVPFSALAGPDEQRVFHRLVTCVARSAAERPMLLAVDDLHHADEASQRWIGYLARRIAELPVLLVLTACADPSGPIPLPPATGTSVGLRSLSASAVVRFARAAGLGEDQAVTCVDASAGNPALVQALVADLADGPLPNASSAPAQSRYRDTITDWIRHRVDPHSRQVCLALAVASEDGTPAEPDLLERILDLCPHERPPSPGSMLRLGRLLSHPLAREAVLAAAEPGEIAALHTRIAELLDESGAAATAVASRLLHVDRPGEVWMARSLDEAAEDAVRAGRVAEAAAYLRHALSGPLDPDRRATLTMRLGALELPHSAAAGIRRLRTGLELHTDVQERATAATALSAALVAGRNPDTALRVLHQASRIADDDELVKVLQTLTALVSSHDTAAWRGAIAGLRALAPTAPAAIEPLVCGLITEYEAGAGLCSAAEVLARVRPRLAAPVDPRLRTAWLGSAATLLQWADCLPEARELADMCLPAPPTPPDLTDVGLQCLLSVRAEAALWAGEFHRVIAENAALVEASAGQGVRLPHLTAMVATARFEVGRRTEAWEAVTAVGPSGGDSSWEWNELSYTRALLHAADGNWQAAVDDYLVCGAGQSAHDFVSPIATPWRSGAALALGRLGLRKEARELAEEELHHARTWGTARTVGRALRAYAAAVGGRLALESLTEAAELLRPSPAAVECAETLIDLGRAHIGAGNGRKGREALREADAVALRLAAPAPGTGGPALSGRLLDMTEKALREGRARRRPQTGGGSEALTAAERRIVGLAAEGHTNAQISSALCLTRRTVESHLTSAYKKLRITRRTQLVAILAQDAETARTTAVTPLAGVLG